MRAGHGKEKATVRRATVCRKGWNKRDREGQLQPLAGPGASQDEVGGRQGNRARQADLEIGNGIAVDIAFDECVRRRGERPDLARSAGEGVRFQEGEGLVGAQFSTVADLSPF